MGLLINEYPEVYSMLTEPDPTLTSKSNKKMDFICDLGHVFGRKVAQATLKNLCPYCTNKSVLPGFNDLVTTHPKLSKELVNLNPRELSAGSHKRGLWRCSLGHEWESYIYNRVLNNSGCPICAGNVILPGFNDVNTLYPELCEEAVHHIPDGTSLGAKIEWKCGNGHTYSATTSNRILGKGCPYCDGKKVLQGETDLATTHPEIARELVGDPTKYSYGSNEEVLFRCAEGHEYRAVIKYRVNNRGCAYCSNTELLPGFNDIATTHPDLAEELAHPESVVYKRGVKFEWKCSKGLHENFYATITHRDETISLGRTPCPKCEGRFVTKGVNDLWTVCPEIAKDLFDPSLGYLFTKGSTTTLEWKCPKGIHENYFAPPYRRTGCFSRKGTSCPKCSHIVSSGEQELQEYVLSLIPDALFNKRGVIPSQELDIYIPSLKIAIEFNGIYWHSDQYRPVDYHHKKTQACAEQGIQLIHIWEDDYVKNPELIHKMIAYKLGVSSQPKVPARKTVVEEIDTETAKKFLNENHIQGFGRGSIRLGLFTKSDHTLVAVTTLKRTQDTLTLERYATACVVQGGQSKFLKYIDRNIEYSKMITFADLTVSDGSLYESTGWVKDKELPPDYKYVVNRTRVHKFNYRLKRFKNDPTLEYREDLTEKQLADLNGLPRIYDAGKIRYTRVRNSNQDKDKNAFI